MKTKILLVLFFIFFNGSFCSLFAQNKGARWLFENNGYDSAEWDITVNNGILTGSAQYAADSPLREGDYYLSLEDTANFGLFEVADDSEIDFSNESLAISAWIYPTTIKTKPQFLLIKGDRTEQKKTNNYALRLDSDKLVFIVHDESGKKTVTGSSFSIPLNQWTYVAVYFDNNTKQVYFWNHPNSAAVDTLAFDATLAANDDSLYIGAAGKKGNNRFQGRVDDVKIGNSIETITNINLGGALKKTVHIFQLYQNYPNPFNPSTTIRYSLDKAGKVELAVYNVLGKKVRRLLNRRQQTGSYSVIFNAENLASGIYFYNLFVNGVSISSRKMVLIR